MTEQALARAWFEQRNADAFRGICEQHSGMVYATALRMLRNAADAEDITQECFLRLARTSTALSGSLGAWLHRVAVNLSIDRIRRESSRRVREEAYGELSPATTETTWNDLREHVDAAIDALPDTMRDTIIAHFIQGVPQHVIADAEGVTRSAISQRINRALQSIRATLEKRGVTVSLTALTGLLTAHMAEAVAVPAGLAASLGNLAVYAGASQAGAGVAAGLVTAKGIAALVVFLLAVAGAGVAIVQWHPELPVVETAASRPQPDVETLRIPEPVDSDRPDGARDATVAQPTAIPAAVSTDEASSGATVEGWVRERDTARPLEGVQLVCLTDDGTGTFQYDPEDAIYTDNEGRYHVKGLQPGKYKILCTEAWRVREAGDPADYEFQLRFANNENVRRFQVDHVEAQAGPNFEAILGETISGFVVDGTGTPVADAGLTVYGEGTFANTQSTASGWFKVGGFPVSDEVLLDAKKDAAPASVRVPAEGERKPEPETKTLTSAVTGPLTMVEGGLNNVRIVLRQGASVSGLLVDPDGKPLAGVNVMARSTAKRYFGSRMSKTNAEGRFVLSGLAEGPYDLAWNPRKPGEDELHYGWTPAEALVLKRVAVTWDQHMVGVRLQATQASGSAEPSTGWIVAGHVRDTRGNALEGATVVAQDLLDNSGGVTTKTGPDGRYELAGLLEEHYYLFRVSHVDFSEHMESLREPLGRPLDVMLEDPGIVSGQVRYADTGMPVKSFYLHALKGNRQPVLVENEEGRFRLEDADAGENAVVVSTAGYKETQTPVTVLPGREVTGVDAKVERGLAIGGIVVTENGAPADGARLYMNRVPSTATERDTRVAATSGSDGRFRIENLERDSGTVGAWHADLGQGAAFYDPQSDSVEIVLRNNLGSVAGQVIADGKVPLDAQVSIAPVSIFASPDAAAFGAPNRKVKEGGTFEFNDVPEGEYTVTVSIGAGAAPNPLGRNLARKVLVEAGVRVEVLLDLPPADASIEGRVLYLGKPVPEGFVFVTMEFAEGTQSLMAQIGADGSYIATPLPAGHATLRTMVVTHPDSFSSASRRVDCEVGSGETIQRDIVFDATGSVRGTVTGIATDQQVPISLVPADTDLSAVTLETILGLTQQAVAGGMVRGPGQFVLSAVPPGDYMAVGWFTSRTGRIDGFGAAACSVPGDGTPAQVVLQIRPQ